MGRKLLVSFFIILSGCNNSEKEKHTTVKLGDENVAYHWASVSLEATARDTERFRPRPTVTSRILALIWTSVFDAWTRYDATAEPVFLKGEERKPESERTISNKEEAISYAAYIALMEYYVSDSLLYKETLIQMGYSADMSSVKKGSPASVGIKAARAVIAARKKDGSNQYGDEPGAIGKPYFDYTGYVPVNSADELKDINRWQPKYFSDGKGGKFAPGCLTPHWPKVHPLVLDSASQFRPGPPPLYGSEQLKKEVAEVVELQASLTREQKALVEFMRDGPKSVQQAGHWLVFSRVVSKRDKHDLDADVKMYFLITSVAMDAFIAAWDAKMKYDFARPYALVHDYFKSKTITAWGGPDTGMIQTKGENWRPYSPNTFLCPPFPSYVSGHSCVSGACSEALRLFTGSDTFGDKVRLLPGSLTETHVAKDSITLEFPTFTQTAEMAGFSRVLGGYHIQADNVAGLELGRNIARFIWSKYLVHIGTKNNK